MTTIDVSALSRLPRGGHACWIVDDPEAYTGLAAAVLAAGRAAGEKPVAFGPAGSRSLLDLAPLAAIAVDPRLAFLHGGPLEPETMFAMFREQSALARAEGYRGICLVADMDWLLPLRPATETIVGFELLLDRLVAELGATIVCAYRRASFDTAALTGTLCVHAIDVGTDVPVPFRLVAADAATWLLSGEVDLAGIAPFVAAFDTAARHGPCVVDVSGLDFIDVAGMRAIASVGRDSATPIRLQGASAQLRRLWTIAGFDRVAQSVQLVAVPEPR